MCAGRLIITVWQHSWVLQLLNMKRINILGSGPGRLDVPANNGEIWGVNNIHLLQNVDVVVDIHNHCHRPEEEKDKLHMAVIKEKGITTYSQNEIEGNDSVKKYPIDEIMIEFGTDYFGSGIDYIIALAIYKGATEIHMYGVCMMDASEYSYQKPSVEFWIGIAKGRGINIVIHGKYTELLKTRNGLVYGYQTFQNYVKKERPNEISMAELIEQYE